MSPLFPNIYTELFYQWNGSSLNPFLANVSILYSLKRGYKMGTLARNGLIINKIMFNENILEKEQNKSQKNKTI